MAKWRRNNDKHDQLAKRQAMGKKKYRAKPSNDQGTGFEKSEDQWNLGDDPQWFAGRVVEVHKRYAFVSPEHEFGQIDSKTIYLATVARKFLTFERAERNFIVVGDRVLCRMVSDDEAQASSELPSCVINHLAPRQSAVRRKDPISASRSHVLASNIDQLLIVASYRSPKVKWGLIDRYLLLAEEQEIEPMIVLTKQDLLADVSDEFRQGCEKEIETYRNLGYKVVSLSILDRKKAAPQLKVLSEFLHGSMTLLSGHSGVGKSSLINEFKPEIIQEVEPNSDIFYKGRHTTTYASLIKLAAGGAVIDTPGIRSFVLDDRSVIELSYGFREIRQLMSACKFRECRHIDEPQCAVLAALEQGKLSERRYRSFKAMLLGESGREGRAGDS